MDSSIDNNNNNKTTSEVVTFPSCRPLYGFTTVVAVVDVVVQQPQHLDPNDLKKPPCFLEMENEEEEESSVSTSTTATTSTRSTSFSSIFSQTSDVEAEFQDQNHRPHPRVHFCEEVEVFPTIALHEMTADERSDCFYHPNELRILAMLTNALVSRIVTEERIRQNTEKRHDNCEVGGPLKWLEQILPSNPSPVIPINDNKRENANTATNRRNKKRRRRCCYETRGLEKFLDKRRAEHNRHRFRNPSTIAVRSVLREQRQHHHHNQRQAMVFAFLGNNHKDHNPSCEARLAQISKQHSGAAMLLAQQRAFQDAMEIASHGFP